MNDIDTVSESFISFLESQSIATFEVDLFLNQVPDTAPDDCWWVRTAGGFPVQKLATGEKVKQYSVAVYHRSTQNKEIEKEMFSLEELLNSAGCLELEGFEVIEVEATQFPSDEDMDSEERRIGLLEATVRLYKSQGVIAS